MVYDCFQFFNELDILNIRLHVLNDVVDRFVSSEATETFSGLKKPLYYEENKGMFREFEDKIIHVVVDDTPAGYTHDRDTFQKNAVTRGLKDCTDDDVIIFSDLDEIPNPDAIKRILDAGIDKTKVYHFAQRLFYCYLNMEEVSGKLLAYCGDFDGVEHPQWIGTKMCSYSLIRKNGWQLGQLRFPEMKKIGIRVPDGGWHFGYMGGHHETDLRKRVSEKVVSAAHQELNSKYILDRVEDNVLDGKDLFGRDSKFVITEIDSTYPKYLRDHLDEYDFLILKKEKPAKKRLRHIREAVRDSAHSVSVSCKRLVKHILRISS